MEKTKGKSSVVLYLADLDAAAHRRYYMVTDHFAAWVDFDRAGINVEHVPGLLRKPNILCDDRELRDDRFFSKELSLPGCYSLNALEPPGAHRNGMRRLGPVSLNLRGVPKMNTSSRNEPDRRIRTQGDSLYVEVQ